MSTRYWSLRRLRIALRSWLRPARLLGALWAGLLFSLALLGDPEVALATAREESEDEDSAVTLVLPEAPEAAYFYQINLLGAGLGAYEAGGGIANAPNSIAIGPSAQVDSAAYDSIAIGRNARVVDNSYKSIAIGADAVVDGLQSSSSIAFGDRSRVGKDAWDSVAVGYGAEVADQADFGIALGTFARVDTGVRNGMALGQHASVQHTNSVALGANTTTDRANSVAVGTSYSTRQITGVGAATQATDAVNLSQLNNLGSSAATALGTTYNSTSNSLALPTYTLTNANTLSGNSGTANNVGAGFARVDAALGTLDQQGSKYFRANSSLAGATATGSNTLAAGPTASAQAADSVAIGNGATTLVDSVSSDKLGRSVALGFQAKADREYALAFGSKAHANGDSSIALGAETWARGYDSIALGTRSGTGADWATALGAYSSASAKASTTVGYKAQALHQNSVALGAYSVTDRSDSISVGAAGQERQITHVAAGSADTDAVNLAQLNAATDGLTDLQQDALRWDAGLGAYSAARSGAPAGISNLADGEVSADSSDAITGAQLFQTNQQVASLDGRVTTIEGTLGSMASGGSIKYFHTNSSKADSSATGSDALAAGPAASASGAQSTALGNQADAAGDDSTAIGSGATASADNAVALGANSVADRDDSVSVGSDGNERQITHVADGTEATDAVNKRQLDNAVDEAKQYTDATVTALNGDVQAMDGRIDGAEQDIAKLNDGQAGMFQTQSSAIKPSASGNQAVAGGSAAVASGDNSTAIGHAAQATAAQATAVGQGASASARNAVALGANSVADRVDSVSIGSAGAERQLTNVAAATQATDAVNLAQLERSVADVAAGAYDYTTSIYNSLRRDIHQLDDELSAGIAGAMAMSSLPQPMVPGAAMSSVGVANFRGQSALAIGISKASEDGRWITKLQGSATSQGETGVSIGIGYHW